MNRPSCISKIIQKTAVVAVALLSMTVLMAQPADAKIEQLLEAQSAIETIRDRAIKLVAEQRAVHKEVDPIFWQNLIDDIEANGAQQLRDAMLPIYKESYTDEELEFLINYFTSDLGRSIQEKSPMVQQQVKDVGIQWGQSIAARVLTRVQMQDSLDYSKELQGCEDLHVGEFLQVFPDGSEILIHRGAEMQVEHYQGNKFYYTIEWLKPCRYRVVESDAEGNVSPNAQALTYNIYDLYDGGHKVITHVLGTQYYDKSDLYPVAKN